MKDIATENTDLSPFRDLIGGLWQEADFASVFEKTVHRDVVLHGAEADYRGRVAVATEALAPMVACPDRRVNCEDMMLHHGPKAHSFGAARLQVVGHHTGGGLWGAPTGCALSYAELVEVSQTQGRISDIWRVRDTGAILRQLGCSPERWADDMLEAKVPSDVVLTNANAVDTAPEPGNDSDWAQVWSDLLERVMEGGFHLFHQQYDPGSVLRFSGGETVYGPKAAQGFWMNLRSCFPSAEFHILRKLGDEAPLAAPRAALRWELRGRHDGWGAFGAPTGAAVVIRGLSQAEFGPDGVRREWSLYDTGAVWAQIRLGRVD